MEFGSLTAGKGSMADPVDLTKLDFEALLPRSTADVLATPGLEGLDLSRTSPDAYLLRALAQSNSRLAYLLSEPPAKHGW